MTTTDDEKAAKAWHQRNSDGLNSFGETGELERTQSPPGFDLVEYEDDTASFAGLQFPVGRMTPDDTGYSAMVVRHTHLYDPSLEDPDA
jgi:hypothetical protein